MICEEEIELFNSQPDNFGCLSSKLPYSFPKIALLRNCIYVS